jgi:hypothetical protein
LATGVPSTNGTASNETESLPQGLKSVCENCISKLSPAGTAENVPRRNPG